MPTPEQNAYNASRRIHRTLRGISVTITSDGLTSDVVTAMLGFSGDMLYDEGGTQLGTRHRAYIIRVDEYDVGNGPQEPQRHDIITQVIDGQSLTFEVVEANGTHAAVYDDTNRTYWRVNTKEL